MSRQGQCETPNCDRTDITGHGYCKRCYQYMWRYHDMTLADKIRYAQTKAWRHQRDEYMLPVFMALAQKPSSWHRKKRTLGDEVKEFVQQGELVLEGGGNEEPEYAMAAVGLTKE